MVLVITGMDLPLSVDRKRAVEELGAPARLVNGRNTQDHGSGERASGLAHGVAAARLGLGRRNRGISRGLVVVGERKPGVREHRFGPDDQLDVRMFLDRSTRK